MVEGIDDGVHHRRRRPDRAELADALDAERVERAGDRGVELGAKGDADRSARSSATISTVSFVAGGALLAAGVILLVASRSTTPAKRATFLTPALGALEVGPGYAAGVARFVW